MDMARRLLSRPIAYGVVGSLLLSTGIILGSIIIIRLARASIDAQIEMHTSYLIIAVTPDLQMPPATPLPTFTPSPMPTLPPPALPAIRLMIPKIGLNVGIEEISPVEHISFNGEKYLSWDPVPYVASHYSTSGAPGEGRNIVFTGHNNMDGEVFRYLDQLTPGEEVILSTLQSQFHYQVEKKFIIPYLGAEEEGNAMLQVYSEPQTSEMVTLISCWPYATNAHRIVIIAVPITP